MIVHLEYRVPVTVIVDTEAETVNRVIIHDEHMEGNPERCFIEASDALPSTITTESEIAQQAVDIANGSDARAPAEWPSWEFGW